VHESPSSFATYLQAAHNLQYDLGRLRPGHVLVVDDDADVRQTLAEGLRLAGFDVLEAETGAEGLQILREDARVGLVLLDLLMPGVDGWQFRDEQRIDPRLASVPTVITTGAPLDDVVDRELKADDYLLKPVGLEHLVSVVAHHVRHTDAVAA
jgi:CheY-like chemotaxis protein